MMLFVIAKAPAESEVLYIFLWSGQTHSKTINIVSVLHVHF